MHSHTHIHHPPHTHTCPRELDLLCLEHLLLHARRATALHLELSQDATRLVGDVDEHTEDLLHHQTHVARPDALGQRRDTTLAEERTREAPVVEVDLGAVRAACTATCREDVEPSVTLLTRRGFYTVNS